MIRRGGALDLETGSGPPLLPGFESVRGLPCVVCQRIISNAERGPQRPSIPKQWLDRKAIGRNDCRRLVYFIVCWQCRLPDSDSHYLCIWPAIHWVPQPVRRD